MVGSSLITIGAEGPAGPKGDTGDAGPKGDAGDVGPKGDAGVKGIDGTNGQTARMANKDQQEQTDLTAWV